MSLFESFVDFDMAKLPRVAALVWIVLYRDNNPETNCAKISYKAIASRVKCSSRQVRRVIKQLEACDLLRVVDRGRGRGASTYRLLPGSR